MKEILKSAKDLRFIFIVILMGRIFDFEEREAMMVLAETVVHLPSDGRRIIARWLQPMSDSELLKRVESIQTLLSIELLKLMPDEEEEVVVNDVADIDKSISSLGRLL